MNISKLGEAAPFSLNKTLINDSDELLNNIMSNSNTVVGGLSIHIVFINA